MRCIIYYRNAAGKLLNIGAEVDSMNDLLNDLKHQQAMATHMSKQLGIAIMLPILTSIPTRG